MIKQSINPLGPRWSKTISWLTRWRVFSNQTISQAASAASSKLSNKSCSTSTFLSQHLRPLSALCKAKDFSLRPMVSTIKLPPPSSTPWQGLRTLQQDPFLILEVRTSRLPPVVRQASCRPWIWQSWHHLQLSSCHLARQRRTRKMWINSLLLSKTLCLSSKAIGKCSQGIRFLVTSRATRPHLSLVSFKQMPWHRWLTDKAKAHFSANSRQPKRRNRWTRWKTAHPNWEGSRQIRSVEQLHRPQRQRDQDRCISLAQHLKDQLVWSIKTW